MFVIEVDERIRGVRVVIRWQFTLRNKDWIEDALAGFEIILPIGLAGGEAQHHVEQLQTIVIPARNGRSYHS